MPTLEKMILAIDSSIGSGVAIVDAESDEVRGQASSEAPRGHAEVIGTLIEQALAEANVTPADITHVAAGMGPGPFTGLRIGIAAARAFAIGRGIPVVPVASHDAAALAVLDEDPSALFVIVTDARRRENAVSAYAGLVGDLPNRTAGPELLPHTEDPFAWLAVHSPSTPGSSVPQSLRDRVQNDEAGAVPTTRIPAANIARIAARMIRQNAIVEIEPLYLRAPDARPPGVVKRVST
ncbi:tRNA (adenosine(37)-N6)-threonylcarbamoyltransferase complex dimerization subunit type 1 TsaB [Microbacterium faecale]|uniref:tRNA (Adenosine(37)-N6)-threonylcarbamoyltransferase complex dimerization subunit type 1 TsaB n=2 Tax=Microbacterium faecale TaxID=1804630 RepID=A0A917DKS6_9MICO|nr:tRNA (adenosine(37)-N6)-threonylcarbamoyltransferase complex dimerization subunit type 1 TsaB [Microbacterium faecale]